MSDISRNNTRRTFTSDASQNNIYNSLYAIVNEMLNGIDHDEIQHTRDFNPFLYRRRPNHTIRRNIDASSPLFNTINHIFDNSRNIQFNQNQNNHQNDQTNDESQNNEDNTEPIIEQITFQVTYPLNFNIHPNADVSNNEPDSNIRYNDNDTDNDNNNYMNSHLNDLGSTISSMVTNSVNNALGSNNLNLFGSYSNNRSFGSTIRNYYNTYPIDSFSTGGLLQQILSQSLYDETAYKKKISDKGKTQLIHVRFDKNNSDNVNTSCPINQTDFENEQYVIKLPCNHIFTPEAINRWLDEKPECPVCRFQLDSIEVKREMRNANDYNYSNYSNQSRMPLSPIMSPIMTPINNSRYNDSYRQMRMIGRDRIHLSDNSYLDYLYEEMDNSDFQTALILSYRELIDISGGNSNNINDNTNDESESENINETQNDNYYSGTDAFERVAAYVSNNIPHISDTSSTQGSEITEPSEMDMSISDDDSDISSKSDHSMSDYYADNDY